MKWVKRSGLFQNSSQEAGQDRQAAGMLPCINKVSDFLTNKFDQAYENVFTG
jgi:hypothetical protein